MGIYTDTFVVVGYKGERNIRLVSFSHKQDNINAVSFFLVGAHRFVLGREWQRGWVAATDFLRLFPEKPCEAATYKELWLSPPSAPASLKEGLEKVGCVDQLGNCRVWIIENLMSSLDRFQSEDNRIIPVVSQPGVHVWWHDDSEAKAIPEPTIGPMAQWPDDQLPIDQESRLSFL